MEMTETTDIMIIRDKIKPIMDQSLNTMKMAQGESNRRAHYSSADTSDLGRMADPYARTTLTYYQ